MHRFFITVLAALLAFSAPTKAVPVDISANLQFSDDRQIKAIIAEVETGWETGDGAIFRKHFLKSKTARYVKAGREDIGLDNLIHHHVVPEKEAVDSLSVDFSDIDVTFENGFAWAIFTTRVNGTIRQTSKFFDKIGLQTFLFRKIGPDWKIVHTHYSSQDFQPRRPQR